MIVNKIGKGIYVHIPFCLKKCNYCDFYSLPSISSASQYALAVLRNIEQIGKENGAFEVDSIFIGGGTPSVIKAELIEKIINKLKETFCVLPQCEISIELNPSSADEEKLKKYYSCGINRISFGMQSSCTKELECLGRLHSAEDVINSVSLARNTGFKNISVDIMLGIPHQTPKSLVDSLEFAASLGVEHVSVYMLKIEDGTPFSKMVHTLPMPDDDLTCDMYLMACERLKSLGYYQYEISNFSKEGFESKHNLKYWEGKEYAGFGCAAHSYLNSKRYSYPRSIDKYISCSDFSDIKEDVTFIDEKESKREALIFGLRLSKGIDMSVLEGYDVAYLLKLFIKQEYCTVKDNVLSLTPKGMLVSNNIISEILLREKDI